MIARNRPTPTSDELAAMYARHNEADRWLEHRTRVDLTIALARHMFPVAAAVVVDPAAGDGVVANKLGAVTITGDLAPTAPVNYPSTDALTMLGSLAASTAHFVILGEILEHVDDPEELLRAAHRVGYGLVLSTPLDEPPGVNPEHVWRWDKAGVIELLERTGWHPTGYVELELELKHWPPGYRCQIHTAERAR